MLLLIPRSLVYSLKLRITLPPNIFIFTRISFPVNWLIMRLRSAYSRSSIRQRICVCSRYM